MDVRNTFERFESVCSPDRPECPPNLKLSVIGFGIPADGNGTVYQTRIKFLTGSHPVLNE